MIECDGLAGPPTPQQASCSQGTTTTPEPTTGLVSNNIFFFHFVAYFQVASVQCHRGRQQKSGGRQLKQWGWG